MLFQYMQKNPYLVFLKSCITLSFSKVNITSRSPGIHLLTASHGKWRQEACEPKVSLDYKPMTRLAWTTSKLCVNIKVTLRLE